MLNVTVINDVRISIDCQRVKTFDMAEKHFWVPVKNGAYGLDNIGYRNDVTVMSQVSNEQSGIC